MIPAGFQQRPLDKNKAWTCLAINLLAFPGLGTILAGRRRTGYPQAFVMVTGFIISVGFIVWTILAMVGQLGKMNGAQSDMAIPYEGRLWIVFLGFGICGVAWLWSLFSSIAIVRSASDNPPPLPRALPPRLS